MRVWQNEAIQGYNNALGLSSKTSEYVQHLKKNFSGVNISVGIPTSQNVFEQNGNNHLMLPTNILQKMAKDEEYAQEVKQDLRVFEKQIHKDIANPSLQSSGFFMNLDGSYGAWAISKKIIAHDSTDAFRRKQQEKDELLLERLQAEELQEGSSKRRVIPEKRFSGKITIENEEIIEINLSARERLKETHYSLDLRA